MWNQNSCFNVKIVLMEYNFQKITIRGFHTVWLGSLGEISSRHFLKVSNGNTRTMCKTYSKLTIKIPERLHWRCSVVFNVNFEYNSHLSIASIAGLCWTNSAQQSAHWCSISNAFHTTDIFLYHPENITKSKVFGVLRWHKVRAFVRNGLLMPLR